VVTLGLEERVGQPSGAAPTTAALARRARGDRTRAALVDAATELFAAKGVEATSVDEITTAAAVAKGTFYVHFQRKQDVLLEQSARFVGGIADDPALAEPAAAAAMLRTLARLIASHMWSASRPLIGRSIREMIGNREQWVRVLGDRPTLSQIIEPIVVRGREDGSIRTDLTPARLAQGLTILWLDAILGWAERPVERDLVEDLDASLDMYLDGARTR
jgi:AcrR family transcriptional regulator